MAATFALLLQIPRAGQVDRILLRFPRIRESLDSQANRAAADGSSCKRLPDRLLALLGKTQKATIRVGLG